MNKTESLDILNKYINALKDKTETEERLSKVDDESREIVREAKIEEFSYGKAVATFLPAFLVLGLVIRMFLNSELTYKNEIAVTVAIFAGFTVVALALAKLEQVLINKKRRKRNKALVKVVDNMGQTTAVQYQEKLNVDNRKIAEAESAIPLSCHGGFNAMKARKMIMSGQAETIEEAAGGYTKEDWEWAYQARPNFYRDSEQNTFGAFALTEATRTVLPKDPQSCFQHEGKTIQDWRMAFMSLSEEKIIGDGEYFQTLSRIERYIIASNEDSYLVRGLTLKELERLLKK